MSELNSRQWALYNYVKSMNDTWTTQWNVAKALYLLDGFYAIEDRATFHDSPTRLQMTADIRAINESSVIQKVIISSGKGIKIANKEEFKRYIQKERSAAIRRLMRVRIKERKGAMDGQGRITFGEYERDTIKAFIDSDKYFGERLKAARLESGWTAKKAAYNLQACGLKIDEPMISRFENGYCMPNGKTLAKFAEMYGVSVEYLLTGELSADEETSENNGLQAVKEG